MKMKTYAVEELANLICQNHSEFAGRTAEYSDILRTIRQTRDFLRSETAARSADFDAWIYIPGSYNSLPSVITIGLAEDGEHMTFTERRRA